MGEIRNAHRVLVGEPEGKKPFARPRHSCEDSSKTCLSEIGQEGVGCIRVVRLGASDGLVGAVINLHIPLKAYNFIMLYFSILLHYHKSSLSDITP
jgi:hypothetical protein